MRKLLLAATGASIALAMAPAGSAADAQPSPFPGERPVYIATPSSAKTPFLIMWACFRAPEQPTEPPQACPALARVGNGPTVTLTASGQATIITTEAGSLTVSTSRFRSRLTKVDATHYRLRVTPRSSCKGTAVVAMTFKNNEGEEKGSARLTLRHCATPTASSYLPRING